MNTPENPLAGGLTTEEAQRLTEQGLHNQMPKSRDGGAGAIFRRNLFTLFNFLNLALAVVLLLVGSYRNMLFLGVILSNILIGTVQELRAKRTHDRLQLLSQGNVKVLRDGACEELPPQALVQGDWVVLSRGDQVPADAEVVRGSAQVDESLLTGESAPMQKSEGAMLYSGSFLTAGNLTARLTAVGAQSYAGKLQLSARKVKHGSSTLMRDMNKIIQGVSIAIVPIGLLLFWKQTALLKLDLADAVTKTVASVLGMIPEGMILLTSVALAVGVVRLGRRKALVNELYGIESLARTDVVCMDKTGTLTNGEMTLTQTLPLCDASLAEIESHLTALLSTFEDPTPTNTALKSAYPAQCKLEALACVPFSSEQKWSAAQFEGLGTVVLGAPERTLQGENLACAKEQSAKGLRVLALLRSKQAINGKALPCELEPMALLCLSDSLRPRVCDTVRYFGEQGVALKVISGDSLLTIARVAEDAGVPNADCMVDLSALEAPIDYQALSREYTIFGRVSPEDKRQLIEAYKRDGHSVAMVGDGVNDIPALKAADCSIAMAGGSDAACRVAQITLLNADFEAMPHIVLEGRRAINNITRASALFLVKNIYSFLLSLAMLGLPFAYPFAPIQLTLISALTIGIPSFVLALQANHECVSGNFIKNVIKRALPGGLCAAMLVICVLLLSPKLGLSQEALDTFCTALAGYSGLVVLALICLPFDPMRALLVVLMSAAFVALVVFLPQVFYLVPVVGVPWWIFAGLAVLTPVLQVGLGACIFRKPKAAPEQQVSLEG
ncbi:MAG: HAD-IC family P-type ATPase [Clostridia bacterium]